ncbi:hypothetical protein [Lysobacter tyrosinilyticus]
MFNSKRVRTTLVLAMALAAPGLVLAEDSEGETPPDEQEVAKLYSEMPKAVQAFVEYLQDLDARYPDSGKVDPQALIDAEGETFALHYCAAAGIDGPCVPSTDAEGNDTLLPVKTATARGELDGKWFDWLLDHTVNVGVIPETLACPAGATLATIHHDDEDRRNINSRSGWIGATSSTANTTWRFCKLDAAKSLSFRPLPKAGDMYDYAVLNMGILCPSGARRVIRVEEDEVWRNANSSSGGVFPNFRVYNTWFNFYCHYDGGANSLLGYMNEFPVLGVPYGVYASNAMPTSFALQKGRVFQDDEDYFNWNAWWLGSGDQVMFGGRNTERRLAKVR